MIKTCLFGFLLAGLILLSGVAEAGRGWYLLLPLDNNPSARISKRWEQVGAYDTAKECQEALVAKQREIEDYVSKKRTGQLTAGDALLGHLSLLWSYAVCVASDDPRLK